MKALLFTYESQFSAVLTFQAHVLVFTMSRLGCWEKGAWGMPRPPAEKVMSANIVTCREIVRFLRVFAICRHKLQPVIAREYQYLRQFRRHTCDSFIAYFDKLCNSLAIYYQRPHSNRTVSLRWKMVRICIITIYHICKELGIENPQPQLSDK